MIAGVPPVLHRRGPPQRTSALKRRSHFTFSSSVFACLEQGRLEARFWLFLRGICPGVDVSAQLLAGHANERIDGSPHWGVALPRPCVNATKDLPSSIRPHFDGLYSSVDQDGGGWCLLFGALSLSDAWILAVGGVSIRQCCWDARLLIHGCGWCFERLSGHFRLNGAWVPVIVVGRGW